MGAGDQRLGGGDKTIIVDDINTLGGDPPLLLIQTAVGQTFRLTGMTIRGGSMSITSNGAVRIVGSSKAVRVDHNHFDHISYQSLTLGNWEYGVVDHNLFDYHKTQVTVRHGNWNGETDGWGDQSWADSSYFGSDKFVFIEDNVFNGNGTLMGGGAASGSSAGSCARQDKAKPNKKKNARANRPNPKCLRAEFTHRPALGNACSSKTNTLRVI